MIYYNISKIFKKSGLSYRKLAEEIGVSYMTIVKLMKAKSCYDYDIGAKTLDKICSYFKCKPTDLLIYKKR